MRKYVIKSYTFLLTIAPYIICQMVEIFARGVAPVGGGLWFYDKIRVKVLDKFGAVTGQDRDYRYKYSMRFVKSGSKVVDLGCGGGRLQKVLEIYDPTVCYIGVDNDQQFVDYAVKNGLDVRLLDLNDLEKVNVFLQHEKPDVVYLMYVFYFIQNSEKLVEVASRHCKTLILGGKNHGHWVQRLRLLFGRAPVLGEPLYQAYLLSRGEFRSLFKRIRFAVKNWPRDVSVSYPRIWTHKDYVAMFDDLGLEWQLIAFRGFRIGDHYRTMLFGTFRAFGFQYALTRKGGCEANGGGSAGDVKR